MKFFLVLLTLVVSLNAAHEVTPIQKVIQLLDDMLVQGEKAKQEEKVQYAAYSTWCDDTRKHTAADIADNEEKIQSLEADIEQLTATIAKLTREIAENTKAAAEKVAEMAKSKKEREDEHAAFVVLEKDLAESVDALERAIAVLQEQNKNTPQSLLQLRQLMSLKMIPATTKSALESFLQQPEDEMLAVAAPEANAYEFQSGGIIEMLTKLKIKFQGEYNAATKTEAEAQHNYEMLYQDLAAQVAGHNQQIGEKKALKGKAEEDLANAKKDLAAEEKALAENKKYLAETDAECKAKATAMESRSKLRDEELAAVAEAKKIMESDGVSGSGAKHLPQLAQTSFISLRATGSSPSQKHAADFLQQAGTRLNSRVLLAIAARVADGPFTKVKQMINDLITRLEEEAAAEAEHKGWCDKELSDNKFKRDTHTKAVIKLTALKDKLNAEIQELADKIAKLTKEIAGLVKSLEELTKIRTADKKENAETVSDAKEAQVAVERAIQILKQFYAKAADATALNQQPENKPEIFDEKYTGMQAENGGVVGMMEVILTDFQRLQSETETEEEQDERAFQKAKTENEKQQATKEEQKSDAENDKTRKEATLEETKTNLADNQKSLKAAEVVYESLKPPCVSTGLNYDDRVKSREQEIQSLREALEILS